MNSTEAEEKICSYEGRKVIVFKPVLIDGAYSNPSNIVDYQGLFVKWTNYVRELKAGFVEKNEQYPTALVVDDDGTVKNPRAELIKFDFVGRFYGIAEKEEVFGSLKGQLRSPPLDDYPDTPDDPSIDEDPDNVADMFNLNRDEIILTDLEVKEDKCPKCESKKVKYRIDESFDGPGVSIEPCVCGECQHTWNKITTHCPHCLALNAMHFPILGYILFISCGECGEKYPFKDPRVNIEVESISGTETVSGTEIDNPIVNSMMADSVDEFFDSVEEAQSKYVDDVLEKPLNKICTQADKLKKLLDDIGIKNHLVERTEADQGYLLTIKSQEGGMTVIYFDEVGDYIAEKDLGPKPVRFYEDDQVEIMGISEEFDKVVAIGIVLEPGDEATRVEIIQNVQKAINTISHDIPSKFIFPNERLRIDPEAIPALNCTKETPANVLE